MHNLKIGADGRVHSDTPAVDIVVPRSRVKREITRCDRAIKAYETELANTTERLTKEKARRDALQVLFDSAIPD